MKPRIKNILQEKFEDDVQEFIKNRELLLQRIEKLLPKIIYFFDKNLKEYNLYDIKTKDIIQNYGSTMVYNDRPDKYDTYRAKSIEITLTFIMLTPSQKFKIVDEVWNYMRNIFGIDLDKYGVPLDIEFVNLTEEYF